MSKGHAVYFLAAVIAACGSEPPPSTAPAADGAAATPSPDSSVATSNDGELHVDGELADGDVTLPTGALGDRHELEVRQGEVVEIVLQSADFDTYLQVDTPTGESRVNDDYPGTENQSRLTLVIRESGQLKITATSYAPDGRGRYRLDVTRSEAAEEQLASAAQFEPSDFGGDFLPNALRIARELLSSRRHHRVDLPPPPPAAPTPAPATPAQPATPTPAPTPTPGHPTLPPGRPANPGMPGQPGVPGQPAPGLGTPIQIGTQLNGRLEQGDQSLATGELRDIYSFPGQAGTTVNIELTSSDFDPYVILVSPSGQQWENDDANGTLNSQLIMSLPEAGTYRIVVTSYRPGMNGDYQLKLRTPTAPGGNLPAPAQPQPTAQPLQTFNGDLAQGDTQLSSGEFVDRHPITLQVGQPVQIRLTSSQFDTYLLVRAPSGRQWDNDDFQQGSLNSGLDLVPPESGEYTLGVTSYRSGETGSYELTVTSAAGGATPPAPGTPPTPGTPTPPTPGTPTPPTPGVTPPTPAPTSGQPIRGALAQGDSQLRSGEFMDAYPMQFQAGERVSFRVNSTQFDTYIIVRAPSGRQWDNDDIQPGNLNSGLDLTLTEAGNYRVMVTSYRPGMTGAYTLAVTRGGAAPAVPGQPPGVTPPTPGQPPTPVPPGGVRPQPGGGRVFGIYVGITAYPSGRLPLCAEDAIKLAEDMRRAGLQTAEQQILLTDANATPQGVRQAFQRMAGQVGPNDLFIFFYSGHGAQGSEQAGSQELDRREESINLIGGDLGDDEMARLFDQIRARVAIIALDSCFSGGFARDVISRPGRMGFFSSEEDLTSSVASRFQAGGYLSHFLRLGLRGEADNSPRDSLLTAGELTHYLYTQFGSHMQDVRASTTDQAEGHQHLVIDRGSVRVSTPLVSYR